MATVTASLAQSTVIPPANHVLNILGGSHEAILSTSAVSRLLMAKIPANAKRVQVLVSGTHGGGTAAGDINIGIVPGTAGSNTLSISAFGSFKPAAAAVDEAAANFLSGTLDMSDRWNQVAGETFKYIVASNASATITTAFSLKWQITYGF